MSDETLEQLSDRELLLNLTREFSELKKRLDGYEAQFEAIRQGIAHNNARFDQLEAIALDAKSIALQTRSQLTILTEEVRQMKKEVIV